MLLLKINIYLEYVGGGVKPRAQKANCLSSASVGSVEISRMLFPWHTNKICTKLHNDSGHENW